MSFLQVAYKQGVIEPSELDRVGRHCANVLFLLVVMAATAFQHLKQWMSQSSQRPKDGADLQEKSEFVIGLVL